ncbi:recombinase XerD [Collinsella sp. AF23-4AC]|nr:recombinase XerD [Collinsella sp. AF23-6]RGS25168.1 recombinase XerD [Collinsella sp. AF23-4AC]
MRGYSIRIAVGSQLNGYLEELFDLIFQRLIDDADSDWDTASLLDIADYKNGLAMQKFRPDTGDEGLPVLKIRELGQGFCGSDAERCKSGIVDSAKVHDGDLIFSWSGTLLLDFWAGGNVGLNQHLFKVTSSAYPSWFYYGWTKHHLARFIMLAKDRATTMGHIKRSALAESEVVIPPENILLSQTQLMQPIIDQYVMSKIEARKLAVFRDSLLPKLMSGEIDVSEVNLTQLNSHLLHYVQHAVHTVAIVLDERSSVETVINAVLSEMQSLLDPHQLKHLAITLRRALGPKQAEPGQDLLALFLTAKEVEGCSPKTIAYYEATLQHMNTTLAKPYTQVESDDLRRYLNDYEVNRGSSKVTIDNIRRIMSSFFSWLEDEDYIVKSPVRRIRRVKTAQVTKEVLSDEELEVLRDACESKRDLAIVDLLASTGMRIGELVRLDRKDVNLHERECLVMGKGNKQRPVYFDARAKLHLTEYLSSRVDKSPALFVALDSSARRITVGSIELRLRDLGRSAGINRVHPHKFRRTLATHAIDKGMPIEQVQKLLGHAKIDTTMYYAMVNQSNVKASHRKYLE